MQDHQGESIIRNVLIRVDPRSLDNALQLWNKVYSEEDESLAIDGKVMCNAIEWKTNAYNERDRP